jgi:hypothetical protein
MPANHSPNIHQELTKHTHPRKREKKDTRQNGQQKASVWPGRFFSTMETDNENGTEAGSLWGGMCVAIRVPIVAKSKLRLLVE